MFFFNPTDETEVKNIIFPLNPSKAICANSIPITKLKFLIDDVSAQLTELFKLSFSYLLIKKTQNWSVLITGKYTYDDRILTKYFKDLCTIAYIIF